MKDTFVLKTTIKEFSTMKECFEQEKIGKEDLIITNEFIYNSKFKEIDANVLFQERYGVGEPTDEMIENIRKDVSKDIKRIIAIGGGSAIDSAKAIGARAVNPKRDLSKMKGILKVWHKLPPFIAIPTTAGTGSEVTLAAVITDEVTHNKYAIMDFPLIPKYAVLDPKMTYTLPKSLTASTGMDALTHAIEAYIGNSTTKKTRELSLLAIRGIYQNILTAYTEPTNEIARRNMSLAAYQAGIAFSMSYVGYIHAIAHSLGGFYDIPHGLANAVVMPIVLESYGSCIHKKMHDIAIAAGISNQDDSDEGACNKMIQSIRKLNQEMNIPSHIREIRTEDIPKLAHHASKEANPLYPVPVIYDDDKLAALYKLVKGDIEYGTNENMQYAKRVFFKW